MYRVLFCFLRSRKLDFAALTFGLPAVLSLSLRFLTYKDARTLAWHFFYFLIFALSSLNSLIPLRYIRSNIASIDMQHSGKKETLVVRASLLLLLHHRLRWSRWCLFRLLILTDSLINSSLHFH